PRARAGARLDRAAARARAAAGGTSSRAARNRRAARLPDQALQQDSRRARRTDGVRAGAGRRDSRSREAVRCARREARSEACGGARRARGNDQGHDHTRVPVVVPSVCRARRRGSCCCVCLSPAWGRSMTQRGAVTVLGCVIVAATAVAITELARGATNNGVTIANPCKERAPFPGHGIDATIQRVVLDGFDGAACRLRTSREQLVLSLRGGSHRWNRRTIETALPAGLLRAVDDAERRR